MNNNLQAEKPLTVGKLALGVALGMLLSMVVLGAIYYFSVEIPRRQEAASHARADFASVNAEMNAQTDQLRLENDRIEAEIRSAQPGSPCNPLTGSTFVACNDLKTRKDKAAYAASHGGKPTAVMQRASSEKVETISPVPGMKYPECADRPASIPLEACEAALDPDREDMLIADGCRKLSRSSHAYRQCVLKSLGS